MNDFVCLYPYSFSGVRPRIPGAWRTEVHEVRGRTSECTSKTSSHPKTEHLSTDETSGLGLQRSSSNSCASKTKDAGDQCQDRDVSDQVPAGFTDSDSLPSQLWAEADGEMAEGRPEGPGELTAEGSEEQQHAEYQPGPSTGQRQVSWKGFISSLWISKSTIHKKEMKLFKPTI